MTVKKKKALCKIQEILSIIPELKKVKEDSNEYRLWKHKVDNIIKQLFGENSSEYKSIHQSLFPEYVDLPIGMQLNINYHEAYLRRLDSLSAKLVGLETAIELWEDEELSNDNNAISVLDYILPRFHKFARQLRFRYNNRTSFEIKDEYDVQDLLHAILKLHFDDIRKEENIPSYAGSSARADFLLKNEKIIVEVKMTRNSLKDKELSEQLISDKAHYKEHPDCKTLVCFIYDPNGLINNPVGLKNDLSEINSIMSTIVVISPNYQ